MSTGRQHTAPLLRCPADAARRGRHHRPSPWRQAWHDGTDVERRFLPAEPSPSGAAFSHLPRSLEELGEEECFALLQSQDLGRLAIVRDGRPEIFPVNYTLVDHIIVIRTQPGVKLSYATLAHVAFEVEDIDRDTREGWGRRGPGTG